MTICWLYPGKFFLQSGLVASKPNKNRSAKAVGACCAVSTPRRVTPTSAHSLHRHGLDCVYYYAQTQNTLILIFSRATRLR